MIADAWSNEKDMSTPSEERRRTEAALVQAIDASLEVSDERTHSAVCAYVDMLVGDDLLPEAVVIAFKTALGRVGSLHRLEAEDREAAKSALVSACIDRYFMVRVPDDVRITRPPALRLIRDEREAPRRAQSPDATA